MRGVGDQQTGAAALDSDGKNEITDTSSRCKMSTLLIWKELRADTGVLDMTGTGLGTPQCPLRRSEVSGQRMDIQMGGSMY